MIKIYTQFEQGKAWLEKYSAIRPVFACLLGFTATGLIPHISAAGKTPQDRYYTAIADAEFLIKGVQPHYTYPLPPLTEGVSPVLISRAVLENCQIPIYLFNTGLPIPPAVPCIDLSGIPAKCLSTGLALPLDKVTHLFEQGLIWGEKLAHQHKNAYLILSECVVGGTTTALAILTALGIDAQGKVNSSHPQCNHRQKWEVVQKGLKSANLSPNADPFTIVAALGDPMQIVAAGMAIAASRQMGVLLAGGTQMLAVWALIAKISEYHSIKVNFSEILVGTTRWVAEDPTGDTISLASLIGEVPLLATTLSFQTSGYPQLQVYEQGFVKEGVGAGGCAIAASLYQKWTQSHLLSAIESILSQFT